MIEFQPLLDEHMQLLLDALAHMRETCPEGRIRLVIGPDVDRPLLQAVLTLHGWGEESVEWSVSKFVPTGQIVMMPPEQPPLDVQLHYEEPTSGSWTRTWPRMSDDHVQQPSPFRLENLS